MAIRGRNILGVAVLVGASTVITGQVVSQQKDDKMADMMKMMEYWKKLAEPGPEHAEFNRLTGTWVQQNSHWMEPGGEPHESTSIARLRTIMGGRFVLEEMVGESEFMGQRNVFEGLGIFGYDNFKKKHVFAWVDNMGTMIMTGEGTADRTGNVITYFSDIPDPETGKMCKIKSISRMISDGKTAFEMYKENEDGSWFKNMEIVSNRM